MSFELNISAIAAVASNEKTIGSFKDSVKEGRDAINERKIDSYAQLISSIAGVKLVKGNLPRAVSNQLRKALLEDAGVQEATAKRYVENSAGALRLFSIPTQATPTLVADILASENIDTENKLAKLVSGEGEADAIRALAEKLVGKFTNRKDDDGKKVQGVFEASKLTQADWDEFDDVVRELKAARAAAEDAAIAAALAEEANNALANEVFAA